VGLLSSPLCEGSNLNPWHERVVCRLGYIKLRDACIYAAYMHGAATPQQLHCDQGFDGLARLQGD